MNAEEFRRAAYSAVDEIIDHLSTLDSKRVVSNVSPGYLQPLLPAGPPDKGEKWDEIQKDIETKIMPELETVVLDWMCSALHLPKSYLSTSPTGGGGVIQGSASEAIVTAMIAARERYVKEHMGSSNGDGSPRINGEDEREWRLRSRLVALGSEMSHSSTQKATMITGVKYRSISVNAADEFALTGRGLKKALEEFRSEGLEPFYLTVTLGTTATCAVDRFQEIAEVKKEYPNLWIHVDAAYAGAALLLDEYQGLTKGLEMFDSFDVNMHKWLLTNFDASCMFLPRREPLISALSITPSYLQNSYSASGLVTDYRDWQIPLGRRFRALKIWFVLRSYGMDGLKKHVSRHIELGERFAGWVRDEGRDLFEIVSGPRFALTVLRVKIPNESRKGYTNGIMNGDGGMTETKINDGVANGDIQLFNDEINNVHGTPEAKTMEEANIVTKEVYEKINNSGEIFLTSTMIKDIYAIRVVSANEQTDEQHLRKAFDILVRTSLEVLSDRKREKGQKDQVWL
ncbi:MAG: hypothetical protein Q9216_003609 [Gyalolechia sp. 2 TL-2023]